MKLVGSLLNRRSVAAAVLAASLLGSSVAMAAHTANTHSGATPMWVAYDAKSHTAKITLIASYGGGFDFNGGSNGHLTFTVPTGSKVIVTFTNNGGSNHSAEIVPFAKTPPIAAPAPAFKGAASPNYFQGVGKGTKQVFQFVANKAGNYLLICAVPGHDVAGMWDNFVVSTSAKSATVTKK